MPNNVCGVQPTLTKWSLRDAIRLRGFFPEFIDAMVRLRFRECREVPFVMVSINPDDYRVSI